MSPKDKLQPFLDVLDTKDVVVFAKRLSANDTGASGAHQVGIYLPNNVAFQLSPRLKTGGTNPDTIFEADVLSHGVARENRLTWYNQKTRDECRITRWADERKRNSVLQKDMTGALVVILFAISAGEVKHSWVWFCSSPDEEDLLEERLGVIEPGAFLFDGTISGAAIENKKQGSCAGLLEEIPTDWLVRFPEGSEIVRLTHELLSERHFPADIRLLERRDCEYRIFRAVEEKHVLPKIKSGFQTVDAFVELANSVTNRRKSRSGKSFELQLEQIFLEDKLSCTRGGKTEGKKTPDFLFPSEASYHDKSWPSERIRMLGVKTTCKDRWRQILNEADRIPNKHLITLQEGVSVDQYKEMEAAAVRLVVPERLKEKYPKEIRASLISLDQFIADTKVICEG